MPWLVAADISVLHAALFSSPLACLRHGYAPTPIAAAYAIKGLGLPPRLSPSYADY